MRRKPASEHATSGQFSGARLHVPNNRVETRNALVSRDFDSVTLRTCKPLAYSIWTAHFVDRQNRSIAARRVLRLALDCQGFEDASKAFHRFLKSLAGPRHFASGGRLRALFCQGRLSRRSSAAAAPCPLQRLVFSTFLSSSRIIPDIPAFFRISLTNNTGCRLAETARMSSLWQLAVTATTSCHPGGGRWKVLAARQPSSAEIFERLQAVGVRCAVYAYRLPALRNSYLWRIRCNNLVGWCGLFRQAVFVSVWHHRFLAFKASAPQSCQEGTAPAALRHYSHERLTRLPLGMTTPISLNGFAWPRA